MVLGSPWLSLPGLATRAQQILAAMMQQEQKEPCMKGSSQQQ
jgi:hypothetical protein